MDVFSPSKTEEKLISKLIQSETLVKALTEDSKDNTRWNEAWKRYRDSHKIGSTGNTYKEKDIWGLSNWAQKKGQNDAFDEFKDKCEEKAKLTVNPLSQEYLDFKNYCSRPKTVSKLRGDKPRKKLKNQYV